MPSDMCIKSSIGLVPPLACVASLEPAIEPCSLASLADSIASPSLTRSSSPNMVVPPMASMASLEPPETVAELGPKPSASFTVSVAIFCTLSKHAFILSWIIFTMSKSFTLGMPGRRVFKSGMANFFLMGLMTTSMAFLISFSTKAIIFPMKDFFFIKSICFLTSFMETPSHLTLGHPSPGMCLSTIEPFGQSALWGIPFIPLVHIPPTLNLRSFGHVPLTNPWGIGI
mmetsp:Transcript_136713/g.237394  ORF Transcript_136713/g.237394 Transcript_136713/m.237394 type:complete len:228 (+) Transcript_136713:692-1375(+)